MLWNFNNLRSQTQIRIDESVLGFDSIHNLDSKKKRTDRSRKSQVVFLLSIQLQLEVKEVILKEQLPTSLELIQVVIH